MGVTNLMDLMELLGKVGRLDLLPFCRCCKSSWHNPIQMREMKERTVILRAHKGDV